MQMSCQIESCISGTNWAWVWNHIPAAVAGSSVQMWNDKHADTIANFIGGGGGTSKIQNLDKILKIFIVDDMSVLINKLWNPTLNCNISESYDIPNES